jgi:hypothetical protein
MKNVRGRIAREHSTGDAAPRADFPLARKFFAFACERFRVFLATSRSPRRPTTPGISTAQNKTTEQNMKKLLAILTLVAFSAGSTFANCGKKVTDEGTLKSYNADKKEITVETKDGKTVARVMTPDTKVAGKIEDLIGKAVKVVSEHNKLDSVQGS